MDKEILFRGVGGETLRPLGVCTVGVSIGGQTFKAEFAILARSNNDVILGIDFLRDCGATVDCATSELSVRSLLFSALAEEPQINEHTFCVHGKTRFYLRGL